ncbi:hypothetical protein ABFT80_07925 [Mesorhizobium sp. SB112]|uniref:hypothetical protein n=1 Tax=Mesorhizobium sp. SB112 TaxID=3151853 RepID=UPI003262D24F
MAKRQKAIGKCLLTGHVGPFAQSHLIPRFLADKALGQAHRIQFGFGSKPQLKFNSWVDGRICTAVGEARLRDIDTAAAKIIRQHGLTWRHYPLSNKAERHNFGDEFELITIPDVDTSALRLFFLSLLWRSAISTRFEFAEIFLDAVSNEHLRKIVAGEEKPADSDWPVVLVALTEAGEPQVHTPLAQVINTPEHEGTKYPDIPIFRFFLDGLIVHMGRKFGDVELLDAWSPKRVVGLDSSLILIGRPYEGSAQKSNLTYLQNKLHREYPEDAARIYSTLWKIDIKAQP